MSEGEDNRDGQVLLIFVVVLVVLCAFAVLTVDMGHVMFVDARLQNGADASSLAGLLELWEQRGAGEAEKTCRTLAEAEILNVVQANYPESSCDVLWGYWIDGNFVEDPEDDNGTEGKAIVVDAVKVRARKDATSPGGPTETFFGSLFGFDYVEQQAVATSHYRHPGLIPLTVREEDIAPSEQQFVIYNETETVPGNCGLLDFNGGKNSATETVDWLQNGYDGPFEIDHDTGHIMSEGSPGLKSVAQKPIRDHIVKGDTVTACIYSSVVEQGASASYEVTGFVALTLDSITMDDKKGEEIVSVTATTKSKYISGSGETEGVMRDFMRLELVK